MTFAFSDEQHELRRGLRRFLDEKSPSSEVRRLMETDEGYDPVVWTQMARELGLQGLTIPEAQGGSGLGPVEQLIVLEEMGRALLCAPYFSTVVLAVNALRASEDQAAQAEWLPGIADGSTIATLAVAEDDGAWTTDRLQTRAHRAGDAYVLDGRKSFVVDAALADLVLVVAKTDSGPSLFAVEGHDPRLSRRTLQTIDRTRKQAALLLDGVPARLVGTEGAATRIVDRTVVLAIVALAAEQVGGAQRCLDMSVDYAKVRVQFGRPIGSFQAIKHKCADMLLEVELARSAAYYAAWAAADGSGQLPLVASLAKARCSDAYFRVAAENIQIHGGIGFTWEHDAHLYYRRAKASEMMLGSPTHHGEVAATHLIDGSVAAAGWNP
jgi:alkylation response protein AidB-like acyl-CoA dehydrogenase